MAIIEKIVTVQNMLFMLKSAGWSILMAIVALIFGTILGIFGALGRISKHKTARTISTVYVEFIRGTPMLLQVLFLYLAVPAIVRSITGHPLNLNAYTIGMIAMSINSGAYSTELIRSAIEAIDIGQTEAGKTLGLSRKQILKLVVLPQAFKHIIPPLVNEFVSLVKESAILSNIGAIELTKSAQVLGATYYNYIIPLLIASLDYLVITVSISLLAKKLERRLASDD